jgi:hypothetical protein
VTILGKSAGKSSDSPKISTAEIKAKRAQFNQHVTPALEAGIQRLAPFLARGDIDFDEAVGTIMRIACKRGAFMLPSDDLTTIHHWVMDRFVALTMTEGE